MPAEISWHASRDEPGTALGRVDRDQAKVGFKSIEAMPTYYISLGRIGEDETHMLRAAVLFLRLSLSIMNGASA